MTPLKRAVATIDPLLSWDADGAPAVDIVRAVIAAIRDPGNDIVQVGFDAEATANPHKTQPHHVVPAVWEAMIDALLAEG